MKKKLAIALCSTLLVLGGCSKKTKTSKASASARPKASEKASESPEPSESAAATESAEPTETPEATKNTDNGQAAAPAGSTKSTADPNGTYQIVSYDNGSGNKQTFTPGKDKSIMGSSSVVLNQDGSCQFNLPGMSSEGCTWKGTQISTGGAQIDYSLNGDEMTVKNAGGTYVFRKTK